jgi:hypothetical protein
MGRCYLDKNNELTTTPQATTYDMKKKQDRDVVGGNTSTNLLEVTHEF